LNDAIQGDGVPAKDCITAVAFEVVVSVTGAVFNDVGLPAFVCVVFFRRPTEL